MTRRAGPDHQQKLNAVVSFTVVLYAHTRVVTDAPERGIEPVKVPIIASKQGGLWRLDCVDLEQLRVHVPTRHAGNAEIYGWLFRAMRQHLEQRGINPEDVKGWSKWFSQYQIDKAAPNA